ncbi:hypothetical protein BC628DRAFT_234397 [Trametes gibbosa]|nr:hypothetical protein BC628DRAFT_234397 [Trametes gibbosa]
MMFQKRPSLVGARGSAVVFALVTARRLTSAGIRTSFARLPLPPPDHHHSPHPRTHSESRSRADLCDGMRGSVDHHIGGVGDIHTLITLRYH